MRISVKDPFLKYENHGFWLRDKQRFDRLILRLKYFIQETSQGRFEELMGKIRDSYAPQEQPPQTD